MKKTSLVLLIALLLLFTFCLTACVPYRSSYKTIASVVTNTSSKGSMSFSSFEGTRDFTLKPKNDGVIVYTAKIASGSATVYSDTDGEKKQLFTISAGEEVSATAGEVKKGKLYIIVESTEKCTDGRFEFAIE